MNPVLLDTDILTYYLKGDQNVVQKLKAYLERFPRLNTSLITKYEILSGLEHKKASRQITEFELFLSTSCNVLNITAASIKISAKEYGRLRRKGIVIGNSDILIAGIALSNNMRLATNNEKHFKHIHNLHIENWKK